MCNYIFESGNDLSSFYNITDRSILSEHNQLLFVQAWKWKYYDVEIIYIFLDG